LTTADFTGSDNTYEYTMRACGTTMDGNCTSQGGTFGGSVCQYSLTGRYLHMLGSFFGPIAPVWSVMNNSIGVSALISNGDLCHAFGQIVPRTVLINFVCAPMTAPSFSVSTSPSNPCAYVITMPTKMDACSGSPTTCVIYLGGYSFDLTSLQPTVLQDRESQYSYTLGVCSPTGDSKCTTRNTGPSMPGSACQYSTSTGGYLHAIAAYTPAASNWTLFDPSHPGHGIVQTLVNGDTCFSQGLYRPRAVIISYECTQQSTPYFNSAWQLPNDPCTYYYHVFTKRACGTPTKSYDEEVY